jgi:hypothetical protein
MMNYSGDTTRVLPRDAKEALELWDKGEAIAGFQVESEGTSQDALYSYAFELIRKGRFPVGAEKPEIPFVKAPDSFTKREIDAARSIAFVALLKGWAPMVAQHLASGHIRAITIKKPA